VTEHVEFHGERSGTYDLTWAQRGIWLTILAARPEEQYLSVERVLTPPQRSGPVTVSRALAAVGTLLGRHETLRTRLTGPDEHPRQLLADHGSLAVHVLESGTDDPAELVRTTFDYRAEWPVRVGLVVSGEVVSRIVLVFSHLAVDGHGADLVVRDLRLILARGTGPALIAAQPIDIAEQERSADGRRIATRALDFWATEHRRIDPAVFSSVPEPVRYREATLHSAALDGAVRALVVRHQVSSSTVLLAATVGLAGTLAGQRTCGLRPIVGNRFIADRQDVVATISEEGLVVLDLTVPTFDDLVRDCWQTSLRAYRHAQYPPDERDSVVAAAGGDARSFGCFNDQRLIQRDDPLAVPPEQAEVRAALADTTVEWTGSMNRNISPFRVHIGSKDEVSLYADTALMPARDIEAYLCGFETLLVEAAFGEVRLSELAALLDRATA
jgi:hypothetical protein